MGFQDLYNPQVRLIKQKLANGEFGKVRSIRGWGNWPRSTGYYSRNAWAGQLRDGTGWVLDSPVNNAMAHFLNLMLYWAGADADSFGEPETIEGDLYRVQGIDSFDTASMRILVKDGPALFYGVSHSGCTYENPIIRVDCENGWVEWDHCGSIRYMKDGEETSFAQPMMDVIRDGMLEVIWSNCCSGSGGVVSIRDAMVHLLCVNALHDASEIRDIPGDFRRTKATKAGEFICVDEICPLLKRAFDEMKLLKELKI